MELLMVIVTVYSIANTLMLIRLDNKIERILKKVSDGK